MTREGTFVRTYESVPLPPADDPSLLSPMPSSLEQTLMVSMDLFFLCLGRFSSLH